jgi:CHAD domain-containing protein
VIVDSKGRKRHPQTLFRKLHELPKRVLAQPSPEAVHRLHTTIRRFETLIAASVAGEADGTGKLLRQLSRLRRHAGKLRDIDVQMAALRTVPARSKRDRADLKRALEALHEQRIRKLTRAIEEELVTGLEKRLKRATAMYPSSVETGTIAHPGALAVALDKFAVLMEQQPPLSPDNLHAFRIACKRICYEVKMEEADLAAQRALKQFGRIQDAIGEWHDWVNLAQSAEDAGINKHSPLLAAIRTGRRARFNEALRITADAKQRLLQLRKTLEPEQVNPTTAVGPQFDKLPRVNKFVPCQSSPPSTLGPIRSA